MERTKGKFKIMVFMKEKMNFLGVFLLAMTIGMGFVACSDEDEGKDIGEIGIDIEIAVHGLTLHPDEGKEEFIFSTAGGAWTATVSYTGDEKDWCTLSKYSGEAAYSSFDIQVTKNEGYEREALITLKAGNSEESFKVIQTGRLLHVNVEEAGTLPELINEDEKWLTKELKLSGELNGTDFYFIREMVFNMLQKIDLSEARIVAGGDYYYSAGGKRYYTEDDVLPYRLFSGCDNLGEIVLPKTITEIGDYALSGTSIVSIDIPEGVTQIGTGTFDDCDRLTSVTLPNTLTDITGAFSGSAITSIDVPESITRIGDNAFANCYKLTSITLPATLKEIGFNAFRYCNITSINLPNSLTRIETYAFEGCPIAAITLPNSLTEIEDMAFLNCSYLKSIKIPESVTELNDRVFSECTNLIEVELPATLSKLTFEAFYNCTNLKAIHLKAATPPEVSGWRNLKNCTLYIPKGSLAAYQSDYSIWQNFQLRFKAIVEE